MTERIEDVEITPGDIIEVNLEFLSGSEYDVIETTLKTRKQINRVSESDVQRVLDELPIDEHHYLVNVLFGCVPSLGSISSPMRIIEPRWHLLGLH